LLRVRSATSAIFLASPAMLRSPAPLITGTTRPFSVSTAIEMFSVAGYVIVSASVSTVAFSFGWTLSASTAALIKNGRYDSFTPSRARKSFLTLARNREITVRSTSTTVVS
jgi:hypothetical protein